MRVPRLTSALAAAAIAACSASAPDGASLEQLARASLAEIDGEIELPGLEHPVEVLRDPWGVPHIYAESVDDLFFAQGFVAAQDRLWQMEWWRRFGEGRLSEVLGPVALQHDRFARGVRYRGDLTAEYTSYHPQGRRIIRAFVSGVNAFIEHSAANPPVEFKLTGIHPEPWTEEVPILRMAGLAMTRNAFQEMRLARRVDEFGVTEANRLDRPDPWHKLVVADGLDLSIIPEEFRALVLGPELPRPAVAPEFLDQVEGAALGSNNWVISGSLSQTGMPLLANDPHRAINLPSLRYLTHLNGPGWNVIGSGEPALPGVAIGHNERVAWGLTIVGIDQSDIFVERLNPENHDEVWHDGQWEPLRVETETIPVKGEEPRVVELKFSHHGPILYEDPDNHVAYAFRSVLSEPGTAGYLGSLILDQAADWDDFLEAMNAWKVPSENMIYADVDGNIGWQAAGLTPDRSSWVGRLPVPGGGLYEWRGFRPSAELPREFNPSRRYITTANHNIMPPGYEPPLGYRWASPGRYHRLVELLEHGGPFGIEDFKRLQHDEYSARAAEHIALFAGWTGPDERTERARSMLADWDAVLGRDSAAAALYAAWRSAADNAVFDAETDQGRRQELVTEALSAAIAEVEQVQGKDWSAWRWGKAHRTRFPHPLVEAYDLPDVERGGDRTTVKVTGQHGASFREIIDVADWDRSVAASTPGQSGQPGSPNYDNLLSLWAEDQYFPLLFSREAVEGNVASRLILRPAGGE